MAVFPLGGRYAIVRGIAGSEGMDVRFGIPCEYRDWSTAKYYSEWKILKWGGTLYCPSYGIFARADSGVNNCVIHQAAPQLGHITCFVRGKGSQANYAGHAPVPAGKRVSFAACCKEISIVDLDSGTPYLMYRQDTTNIFLPGEYVGREIIVLLSNQGGTNSVFYGGYFADATRGQILKPAVDLQTREAGILVNGKDFYGGGAYCRRI